MSKNYMADVAKMLGVELGEEFDFDCYEYNNPYRITADGLVDRFGTSFPEQLAFLLLGKLGIIKKPWRPKDGEDYYYIATTANHEPYITTYASRGMDVIRLRIGNFFKTYEEAKANVDKWTEYISQEPDLSWRNK